MANNDKLKMIFEKNPKLLKKVDKKTEMLSADVFQDDESFKEFRTTEEDTDKKLKSMKEVSDIKSTYQALRAYNPSALTQIEKLVIVNFTKDMITAFLLTRLTLREVMINFLFNFSNENCAFGFGFGLFKRFEFR